MHSCCGLENACELYRVTLNEHNKKLRGASHYVTFYYVHLKLLVIRKMNERQLERFESVKAGLLGAGAIAPLTLILLSLSVFLSALGYPSVLPDFSLKLDPPAVIHSLEVALCGFLFGVTYRYTVRQDIGNFQLKAGTVMAFALVRGLGLGDVGWQGGMPWFSLSAWLGEGVLLFAIAAFLLNIAFQQQWVSLCTHPPE